MITKVKRLSFIGLFVFAAIAGGWFVMPHRSHAQESGTTTKGKTLYTCGMHPQIIQDHPGNCQICGMKLNPIRKQPAADANGTSSNAMASATGERKIKYYKSTMMAGEVRQTPGKDSMGMDMVPIYEDAASDSSAISVDPVTTQNMGIRLGTVTKGPLRRTIRTVGTVEFDETALADVTTKFKGWIEKLYVDSTGRQVHKGEPLFEIYSPELYSAQTEYLLALDQTAGSSGADSLKLSALNKLKFFDISDEQIAELEKTRQPKKTLRVSAPRDGIVVEKMAVEGQMVDAGMKLYRLADLGIVWVQSQVYEQDLPFVELGQEASVTLSYLADRKFRGRVTYVYPTLDEKTRTVSIRMEFHNPGYFLKPGMFATVHLTAELEPSALLVPDIAVLRSGEKNTVFVALDAGKFDPRVVTLGPRSENNMYQVLSGLKEGEKVVTSGQFMFDSESQLREAIQKMLNPNAVSAESNGATPDANLATPSTPQLEEPTADTNIVAYICPMPEHVSIRYDHPGKCPLCSMTLIPVSEKTLAKIQPGGKIEYYTCPMTDACPVPGHGVVKYDKSGKCPVCGMTLVPVMESPKPAQPQTNVSSEAIPAKLYTCPMPDHADVVSDKPGDCPKCGMKLVETSTVAHGKIAEENWRKTHAATAPAAHEQMQ